MTDEDWDWDSKLCAVQTQGRIFGMRGRGFRRVEKVVGLPHTNTVNTSKWYSNTEEDNDNEAFGDNDASIQSVSRGNHKSKTSKYGECNDVKDDTGVNNDRKVKFYVPPDPAELEDDIFSIGISSGINFSKYDDIVVNASGENVPKKIEDFSDAKLCHSLLSVIEKCNYLKPTPIQKYALPIIMENRDMIACAQTGSGKTAAFLIPIINNLLLENSHQSHQDNVSAPQVIVVLPVRELAIQTYIEARKFTFDSHLKVFLAYGGTSIRHQVSNVKRPYDILIGTPGRLKDLLSRRCITLRNLKSMVIDEADQFLKRDFLEQFEYLLKHDSINGNNPPQILMFSATFPDELQRVASTYLKNYIFVTVGVVGAACADVVQRFYLLDRVEKRLKLIELLQETGHGVKTLVFVEKKRTADIIAVFLSEKDIPTTSLHGNRQQILREEALRDFRWGKMDVLVATNVAARGLDIKDVDHVINFDMPHSIVEYVHRIGRTGRVGNRGLASSFYSRDVDRSLAPDLVRILAQAQQEIPDFLQEDGKRNSSYGGHKRFGGTDIRSHRKRNDADVHPVRSDATTYEEEVW